MGFRRRAGILLALQNPYISLFVVIIAALGCGDPRSDLPIIFIFSLIFLQLFQVGIKIQG
jgi:hypothetical protein